jgi:hypothetical protein
LKRKNELIMFYNGNNLGNSGVGYAIKKWIKWEWVHRS